MATAPGVLYTFPWENWGNWKYLLFVPIAVKAIQESALFGEPVSFNIYFHMLLLAGLRYLLFQIWGTASRLPFVSRRHQIQTKGIKFEQVDHEARWESMIFLGTFSLYAAYYFLFPPEGVPTWDGRGILVAFLVHAGPVEWIYYWGHRALHHHYLFTRYHTHHHSSFVTQPITSSNHPFLEHLFYHSLFSMPLATAFLLGHFSVGLVYVYALFVDFMNSWGHCNFEFIPTWVFDALPPLKYIVYSPTYHSLHHSKVHTNFCLFMPLYDYLYGTMDATTDKLHRHVREGHEKKVDCVYLTHATELLSTFHLQFGFQTFAAQPFSHKWYMWLMWPMAIPIMVLAWLFAKPFIGATHFIGNNFQLQTWVIPRYTFQYALRSEKARIDDWIQQCILQAQEAGAKVIALALLNKDRKLDMDEKLVCKKGVSIPIVTGETLAAAIVAKEVVAKKAVEVFLTTVNSRVGRAIATYLCEHEIRVLALSPSKNQLENLRQQIATKFQHNLVHATHCEAGKGCKVWIVGEQMGSHEQSLAPCGTHFHQFTLFPIRTLRKDCTYGCVPGLTLPENAKTINACEDVMPRYVVRASYAAAMVHALEGWHHHDLGYDIPIYLMEASWEAALKHGFSTAKELEAN